MRYIRDYVHPIGIRVYIRSHHTTRGVRRKFNYGYYDMYTLLSVLCCTCAKGAPRRLIIIIVIVIDRLGRRDNDRQLWVGGHDDSDTSYTDRTYTRYTHSRHAYTLCKTTNSHLRDSGEIIIFYQVHSGHK